MSNVLSKIFDLFWFMSGNTENVHCSVFVEFKFISLEKKKEFIELLSGENGLQVTRNFEGCVNINCYDHLDNKNSLILLQQWEKRKNHEDYLKMRKETGLLDKLNNDFLKEPLSPVYMEYKSKL